MVIVHGEVRINPGAMDAVKDVITTMETESLKEPGCHTYGFSVSVSDPGLVRITELWETMEDLAAHFGLPHMADFQAALSQIEILGMEVKAFDVAGEVPLPM
jgi:quinol monooxygenase YgiN